MTKHQLLSLVLLIGMAPITGSFLGVLVHRIPAGRKVGIDRSVCDTCGHVLGLVDLLPLLNWVVSRGRCRYCGARVSAFYPLIELAALGVALWAWSLKPDLQAWTTSILGWALMVLFLINLRHFTLPRALSLPLIALGLAVAWFAAPETFADHLIGAVAGFAAGAMVGVLDRRLDGRLGMGMDGAILLAAAGAWLAWQGLPDLAVAAAVAAAAVAVSAHRAPRAGAGFPGGACAAAALWVAWLYGPVIFG